MKTIVLFLIRFYQNLSPLRKAFTRTVFGSDKYCKFNPTCSQYTYLSINKYGVIKGIVMGIRQFSKCR